MIAADKRKAVYLLHQDGMSLGEIVRRLHLSRNTVRSILKQKGEMPTCRRKRKVRIEAELLERLYRECEGWGQRVHEKLAEEEGIQVPYSTVTRLLRELGLSKEQSCRDHVPGEVRACRKCSVVATRQWLLELSNGAYTGERFQSQLPHTADLQFLLSKLKHGRSRDRKKAATILARKRGISNSLIAEALLSSCKTTRRYYKMYLQAGPEKLFAWNTTRDFRADAQFSERIKRILEIFHHKPTAFGINRTNWTRSALLKAYEQSYSEVISESTLVRILRRADFRWRKAQRVLTSPDPRYHEKVELLLNTLHHLGEDEMLFFLDEWGPTQIRKRGGKAYGNDHATIPRHQVSRGNVSLVGALSAMTNQVTWRFLDSKDSHAMMDMIEVLYNQYHAKVKLYITWDAVVWHNSGLLLEALDQFNDETRALSVGPIIELVPLPTSSQFLNVIEGVLTGMTRAVINNSDYPDAAQMKQAISRHFTERNEHFRDNPRRAGKKIWELDFFHDFDALRAGNYKENKER
jgi:transposase